MCREAFITEVFDFMANSVLGLQTMPELQRLKKKKKKKNRCINQEKYLYFWQIKMHSYSQKCQSDQQRLEVSYVSVFDLQVIFLYIFYLLECAHILCKTLLLYFPYL